ncbi:hypothetical protein BH10ACT4_BH10ACT4_09870 [soil metagenome]
MTEPRVHARKSAIFPPTGAARATLPTGGRRLFQLERRVMRTSLEPDSVRPVSSAATGQRRYRYPGRDRPLRPDGRRRRARSAPTGSAFPALVEGVRPRWLRMSFPQRASRMRQKSSRVVQRGNVGGPDVLGRRGAAATVLPFVLSAANGSTAQSTFGRGVFRSGDFRAQSQLRDAGSLTIRDSSAIGARPATRPRTVLPFVHSAANRLAAQSTFGRGVFRPADFRAHSPQRADSRAQSVAGRAPSGRGVPRTTQCRGERLPSQRA